MPRLCLPLLFLFLRLAAAPEPIQVASLLAPVVTLPCRAGPGPKGWSITETNGGWRVKSMGGAWSVQPKEGNAWSFGEHAFARMEVQNLGSSLLRVDGRLENAGAQDWMNSSPSSVILLPGESGTLGFPYNRPESAYDGPEIFRSQAARPDGHRIHWRSFDPSSVTGVRLVFRTAEGEARAQISPLQLGWPKNPETESALEALPYLDEFGQVRALSWAGKVANVDDLRENETVAAVSYAPPGETNRFGGWTGGPQRQATGRFRTEKIDGKWWLVDPEGRLFWSTGVNSVGAQAGTPLTEKRRPLFSFVPAPADPLFADTILEGRKGARILNYPAANQHRLHGPAWREKFDDLTHTRLRGYGVNTLAAWSEERLMQQKRTPYTLITGVWWPIWTHEGERRAEPFDPGFADALRKSLREFAWVKDDPYCLGVFIDNELDWPDRLGPAVLSAKPTQPTRKWALEQLRKNHPDLADLTPEHEAELDGLYPEYARAYFAACRQVLNEELPGALYLGCRTHRGPPLLGRAAAGLVDVFSVNRYEAAVGAHQLPAEVDMPYLVSEFHFGAIDRGVPSPGLRAVHDQSQRGRAAAAYVASGLLDARCVGAHWFCWTDQSAAGRPGENHQIGFVDVANRPYAEFIRPFAAVAKQAAAIRAAPPRSVEAVLEKHLGLP